MTSDDRHATDLDTNVTNDPQSDASRDTMTQEKDPAADIDASGEVDATSELEANSEVDTNSEVDANADQPLVPQGDVVDLRTRWEAIQQGFVDDPQAAVGDADRLVREVLDTLARTFEEQREGLEGQWKDGQPDTEQLRSALRRYRDFFDRLLSL